MARVYIPPPLRTLTGGQTVVDIPGRTLGEVIANLETLHPGTRNHNIDEDDDRRLVPGLAAVIDGDATSQGLLHKLEADTEVHFLPAIAGGA